jgi:DNA-directed RNA polymerase subunit beta
MEIDPKDIVYIRIDRRRKFPVTTLFKALWLQHRRPSGLFLQTETDFVKGRKVLKPHFNPEFSRGSAPARMTSHPETGDVLVKKGRIFTQRAIKQMMARPLGGKRFPSLRKSCSGKVFAHRSRPQDGEPWPANDTIDDEALEKLERGQGQSEFDVLVHRRRRQPAIPFARPC